MVVTALGEITVLTFIYKRLGSFETIQSLMDGGYILQMMTFIGHLVFSLGQIASTHVV